MMRMISSIWRLYALSIPTFLIMAVAAPSWADCDIVPNGTTILAPETRSEGAVIYNSSQKIFQGCLNNEWVTMHGDNGYQCGFIQGTCPDPSSGRNGCISGQDVSWGTVNCSITGSIQTITFNDPRAIGGERIGGANSAQAQNAARGFCFDLSLAYSAHTSNPDTGIDYYDVADTIPTDSTYWRYRGSGASYLISQVICTDMLNAP